MMNIFQRAIRKSALLRRFLIFCGLNWTFVFLLIVNSSLWAQSTNETPPNFKIAFIGDQGAGSDAKAVLQLIKDEGANAVIHSGDFDYTHDPAGWDNTINSILGSDFPYFASIGNHDTKEWDGSQGYQHYLEARYSRLGVTWQGDLGVQSSLKYKGIFIVSTAPGVRGSGHDVFIRDQLANDNSIWSICSWHKNMKKMQAGGKSDETGWGVYEEARKGGAIIATAHEHSYSRTYLLSDMQNQTIASKSDTLVLTKGKSFAFVSGLGGKSVRSQKRSGDYFASIYTSDQKASPGALFGEFNYNGVANLAHFYFKDIKGKTPDEFWVISQVEGDLSAVNPVPASIISQYLLQQNYPNPFNPNTMIQFTAPRPSHIKLVITDLLGRPVRTLYDGFLNAGTKSLLWDGRNDAGFKVPSGTYIYRLQGDGQMLSKRLTLIQ